MSEAVGVIRQHIAASWGRKSMGTNATAMSNTHPSAKGGYSHRQEPPLRGDEELADTSQGRFELRGSVPDTHSQGSMARSLVHHPARRYSMLQDLERSTVASTWLWVGGGCVASWRTSSEPLQVSRSRPSGEGDESPVRSAPREPTPRSVTKVNRGSSASPSRSRTSGMWNASPPSKTPRMRRPCRPACTE